MQRILVLGAGFAGLWSAVGAARGLDELGVSQDAVEVVVVNRTPWHSIRVRNYEADLRPTLVPLADVLEPIGVKTQIAQVTDIDVAHRQVICEVGGSSRALAYDRLVFALGSRLACPPIPGVAEWAHDVDTFEAAARLNDHILSLPASPVAGGRYTVVVVGAGLTGIEVVCEMFGKLYRAIADASMPGLATPRVILVDRSARVGSDMGESARPVIAEAVQSLGIETRTGVSVASIDAQGMTLSTGERIETATVIWCAGMEANSLTARFAVDHDRLGRVPVDDFLKIKGMTAEFAAGDAAWLPIDGSHASVMSCQHARPMGRFAGHNVASDLFGQPMLPLRIDRYVTVLDLGARGALYTEGWERQVVSTGAAAKKTKEMINCQRIYPPTSRNRREILDAAAPAIQAPPQQFH
jgi:NADH dehydrogenase